MIKIRKAKNDYPGSNFRRIDLIREDGASIPLFGVSRITRRGFTYWESDTRALTWDTLQDVKNYAQANIDKYL